jgi:hypothetical protein
MPEEYFPHNGHGVEVLQAKPQGFRSRLAVAFAPEKTADRSKHPRCFSE